MFKALCLALVLALPTLAAAQTVTAKDLDARLENQLFEVLKLGTDIYNRGGHDACYRLYQGSLMTILGFLDHRPDHAAKIQKALRDSDNLTSASERAHVLRDVMDDLRAAIKTMHTAKEPVTTKPITPSVGPATGPPLWTRLGSEASMKPIVNDWIDRSLKNPRINFTRRGTGNEWEANPENIAKVKKQILSYLSSKTGGPLQYAGQDMKTTHLKMKISEPEFDAFVEDFRVSLDKFFVSPFERNDLIKVLLDARKEIVDSSVAVKSLWERLGGEAAITLVVDDFVTRAAKNPAINFSRKGLPQPWTGAPDQVAALRKQLIHYISSITGGPHKYDGKSMKDAHAAMQITQAEFNALGADLKLSLDLYKVNSIERDELLFLVGKLGKEIVTK